MYRFTTNVEPKTTSADRDDDPAVLQRPSEDAHVDAVEPGALCSCGFRLSASCCVFSSRALSVGVSVNATSIETRIENAIVQPNWFR